MVSWKILLRVKKRRTTLRNLCWEPKTALEVAKRPMARSHFDCGLLGSRNTWRRADAPSAERHNRLLTSTNTSAFTCAGTLGVGVCPDVRSSTLAFVREHLDACPTPKTDLPSLKIVPTLWRIDIVLGGAPRDRRRVSKKCQCCGVVGAFVELLKS